jgi:hypothetical protein
VRLLLPAIYPETHATRARMISRAELGGTTSSGSVCEAGAQAALSCADTDTSMTPQDKTDQWLVVPKATTGGTVDSRWKSLWTASE